MSCDREEVYHFLSNWDHLRMKEDTVNNYSGTIDENKDYPGNTRKCGHPILDA